MLACHCCARGDAEAEVFRVEAPASVAIPPVDEPREELAGAEGWQAKDEQRNSGELVSTTHREPNAAEPSWITSQRSSPLDTRAALMAPAPVAPEEVEAKTDEMNLTDFISSIPQEEWLGAKHQACAMRIVQSNGYPLLVLGTSLEAIRVCHLAASAGFRVELVLVSDALGNDTEAVRREVGRMRRDRVHRGLVDVGLPAHLVDRTSLIVRANGAFATVELESQDGKLTWHGLAVVLDEISGLQAVTPTQRAALLEESLWQKRTDFEAVSPCTFAYRPTLLVACLVMLFTTLPNVLAWGLGGHGAVAWMYPLANAPTGFLFGASIGVVWLSACGVSLPWNRMTKMHALFGVIFTAPFTMQIVVVEGYILSYFSAAFLGAGALCCAIPLVARSTLNFNNLLWYLTGCILPTYGCWTLCGIVMLLYVFLVRNQPGTAALFLSIALPGLRMLNRIVVDALYSHLVVKKRAKDPMVVKGDQKIVLTVSLVAGHIFTEVARLVSMIVGCATAPNYEALAAIVLTFFVNVFQRTGLMRIALGSVPGMSWWILPSGVEELMNDFRFATSWPQYFLVAGIFVGRGLLHGKWQVLNPDNREVDVWCFNEVVLVIFCASALSMLAEDALVKLIQGVWQPPIWRTFGQNFQVQQDLGDGMQFHPRNIFVAKTDSLQVVPRRESWSRSALTEGTVERAPFLKQLRTLPVMLSFLWVIAVNSLVLILFSLGTGKNGLLGFCEVEEDVVALVMNLAVYQFSTACT